MLILADQIFLKGGGGTMKVGETNIQKKEHDCIQFHVYKNRMHPTLKGRFQLFCTDMDTIKIKRVEINSARFHVHGHGYGNGSGYRNIYFDRTLWQSMPYCTG